MWLAQWGYQPVSGRSRRYEGITTLSLLLVGLRGVAMKIRLGCRPLVFMSTTSWILFHQKHPW